MFTRKAVLEIASNCITELKKHGFKPERAIIFGSYAKGTPREHSDIDLAIWDKQFTGCLPIDIDSLVSKHKIKIPPLLELHTFNTNETKETNPFIGEIEKHGILIQFIK